MVSTIDGETSIGGHAGKLGSAVDRRVMHRLRSQVDAVMIGAGTLRSEKMTLDSDNSPRELLKTLVSGSGDLPIRTNLLGASRERTVVFTSSEGASHNPDLYDSAQVEMVESGLSSSLDPSYILETLYKRYSVRKLLVEGGPSLNYQLLVAGLVDELFVTLAPKIVGDTAGDSNGIFSGPGIPNQSGHQTKLEAAYLSDGEIFLRYRLNFR